MKKLLMVFVSALLLVATSDPLLANQGLVEAKKLCQNASPAQRQAAEIAGYDVAALCNSLNETSIQSAEPTTQSKTAIIAREIAQNDASMLPAQPSQVLSKAEQPLSKFGYDLFAGEPTTYTPVENIPVPANYILGPGDVVRVQLYGKENSNYELQVGRDGAIQFPNLGPIYVSGLDYSELKESLNHQIQEQIIGVQANISLGELRSMQIFILGEAYKPGAYTVSSLSTILNALYVSGGVKEIGSLRSIQLKRNGQLISTLDLYDLLLKGDTRGDRRLQAGDVIFIPSLKKTASISGEVVRPAVYELKNEKTLQDLVTLAGGVLPNAALEATRVQRVEVNGSMTVVDVNLNSRSGKNSRLQNGDLVKVYPVLEKQENIVTLEGHVYRDGPQSWRQGMRVSDLIADARHLKPNANIDFVLLIRETQPLKQLKPIKVALRAIFENKNSPANIKLKAQDRLVVLANVIEQEMVEARIKEQVSKSPNNLGQVTEPLLIEQDLRNEILSKLNQKLLAQASFSNPAKLVSISGAVKFPGEYPLTSGMSLVDLIHAAGGMRESAYGLDAELSRSDLSDPNQAKILHQKIDLQQEFLGAVSFKLQPHDQLTIKVTPEYRDFASVSVSGEVQFPGTYRIQRGETLSQLIKRVGGINDFGHVKAAVFSRQELRELEQKELRKLQDRLQQDIAAAELESLNDGKGADINSAKSLLDVLNTTEATGRLVIDLESLVSGYGNDVVLKDGDRLSVPAYRQEITVVGEVQVPTSHLYNKKFDFDDYIERSGGEKETANSDATYIVKADGSVILPNANGWLSHGDVSVEAGDTIVVPLDTTRVDSLELWSKVSSIVYQLALGAAAVNSF